MSTAEMPKSLSGPTERGVVLEGVSWETYEKLIAGFGDRRSYVTYDNGTMEIEMSLSRKHESDADFLRSLVTLVCTATDTAAEFGGSTTHKRKDIARGVEPDDCFWIANEPALRGVDQLDLTKHPAPDLVIEVDLTSRSVDKLDIYATLGVPEIWHVEPSGQIVFLVLDENRKYSAVETSRSFPILKSTAIAEALDAIPTSGRIASLKQLLTNLNLR